MYSSKPLRAQVFACRPPVYPLSIGQIGHVVEEGDREASRRTGTGQRPNSPRTTRLLPRLCVSWVTRGQGETPRRGELGSVTPVCPMSSLSCKVRLSRAGGKP